MVDIYKRKGVLQEIYYITVTFVELMNVMMISRNYKKELQGVFCKNWMNVNTLSA